MDKLISSIHKGWDIKALSLFILLVGANVSFAVPACPREAKVKQPDGTEITVYLRGDEYAHWNESKDGFQIVKNKKSGEWVYMIEEAGKAIPSKHAVGKADPKAIGALKPDMKKLSAQAEQNRTDRQMAEGGPISVLQEGTMYNLVVLVNFSDLTVAYTQQDYNDLFNQIGYTTDGAVGSVKDYYHEISYNLLTVQSTVVEAVTLDYGYAYYGANDIFGYDIRPREMVEQALEKLETRGFDFSTVDGDSDGWIDGLTIIHAGGGEEYSGNDEDYIWSHQWELSSTVTYDGVSMQIYHTEPARRGWDDYPSTQGITRIGVICHENGHFLGLPDLYDYGYDSEGAGEFCLMAGGSWNGDYGTTPAHMSAWCKSDLGWITPTLISSSGSYSLGQVETNAQMYKLQGEFPSTQYFLIENRQGVGFDAALPGSTRGVLIWHIDETQPDNDDQTHYKVDLEEASGTQHLELNLNAGEDSDYFRAGNVTEFSESTTPNNYSYDGQALGLNITDVGTSSASMQISIALVLSVSGITPNVGMSGSTVNITDLAGTGFEAGAIVELIKSGEPNIAATSVTVVSSTKITCTFPLVGAAEGLWDVKVTNPNEQSAVLSNGFEVTAPGHAIFLTEGFESAFVSGAPPGWTKSFETGSVDWARNVGDYHPTDAAHSGTYNAMLFYEEKSDHETYLITPVINFGTGTTDATLEFWHKQVRWPPDQDTLKVYYKTSIGGSWILLESYTKNVSDWTKRTISLPNPGSTYYIGFLGNAQYGYGVCIDDVMVTGIVPPSPLRTLTISSTSGGHTEPNEGTHQYNDGTIVDINAVPDPNYHFINWTGDTNTIADANAPATTITMDANYAILANFAVNQYTITTSAGDNGSINPSGAIIVNHGDSQDFNALPNIGYEVDEWYLDGNSVQSEGITYTLSNITADHNVHVTFKSLIFAISGQVSEIDGYTAVEGVLIQADGNDVNSVTDANGYYELLVGYGWSDIVTPMKDGYVFEPNSDTYIDVNQNYSDMNYTATLMTYIISGYVMEEDDITPISDVNISAENGGGQWTSRYGGGSDTTDANGYYEVVVDYNWSGKVTPTKYAYGFTPSNIDYNNVITDLNNQNYNGKLLTFIISGYIKNECDVPIAGVSMDANNGGGHDTTDVNGYYKVWVDYNWSGTVTPTKEHHTFSPAEMVYVDVLADQTEQNYQAANIYDLDCDGTIGFGDFSIMSENWLYGPNLPGDFYKDGDEIVNFLDFAEFANHWLEGPIS